MNAELCKKALEKIGNPNILVNLISRRVRQLTSSGAGSRPLISDTAGLGAADIAMIELIDGKMDWERIPDETVLEPESKKRKRG